MSALADSKDVLRPGAVRTIECRAFLKQSLSLGALTLLTGCDVTDQDSVQTALNAVSRWNDGVQATLFTNRLVPTYPESAAISPLQRLLWRGRGAEDRRRELQARPLGPDRQPQTVDAARALRPAAGLAGDAPRASRAGA
jgi:hypothetical protein